MAEGGENMEMSGIPKEVAHLLLDDLEGNKDTTSYNQEEETSFIDNLTDNTDRLDQFEQNRVPDPQLAGQDIQRQEIASKLTNAIKNGNSDLIDISSITEEGINNMTKDLNIIHGELYFNWENRQVQITKDGKFITKNQLINLYRKEFDSNKGQKKLEKVLKNNLETPGTSILSLPAPQVDSTPMYESRKQGARADNTLEKILDSEGKIKYILDASIGELKETGVFSEMALREIKTAHNLIDNAAKEKEQRNQKIIQLDDEISKTRDERDKLSLQRALDFQREELEVLNSHEYNQRDRIRKIIRKVLTDPNSEMSLKDRVKLLFKLEGVTIAAILAAIVMVFTTIGVSLTKGGGGGSSPPNTPNTPSIPDRVKEGLQKLAKYLWEIAKKSASALPGIIGGIVSFIFKQLGNVVSVLSEHVLIFIGAAVSGIVYGLLELGKKLKS